MKFISSVKYKRTLKYVEYRRCIDTITQGFSKFCAIFKKDHLIGINLKYEYMRALKILNAIFFSLQLKMYLSRLYLTYSPVNSDYFSLRHKP